MSRDISLANYLSHNSLLYYLPAINWDPDIQTAINTNANYKVYSSSSRNKWHVGLYSEILRQGFVSYHDMYHNGLLTIIATLSGSHDKSCLNSLNAKERCFSAAFLVSYSIGYIGPPFIRLKEKNCPTIPCGIKELLLYRDNAKTVLKLSLMFKATHKSAFHKNKQSRWLELLLSHNWPSVNQSEYPTVLV